MSKDREIKEAIQQIANGGGSAGMFYVADVVSATNEDCVVDIDGLRLSGIRTGAVIDGNENNLSIKPKSGSKVMIADLYGDKTQLMVVSFSEIESITINGGNLGGLVNIGSLTEKLNDLVNKFNNHTHSVSTKGTAAAQTGTAASTLNKASVFNKNDYEDSKIKH